MSHPPQDESPKKRECREEEVVILKAKIDELQAQKEEREKKDDEYKRRQLKTAKQDEQTATGLSP